MQVNVDEGETEAGAALGTAMLRCDAEWCSAVANDACRQLQQQQQRRWRYADIAANTVRNCSETLPTFLLLVSTFTLYIYNFCISQKFV